MNWLTRILLFIISLFVFQSITVAASEGIVNLGFNPHNPAFKTYTHDEIESLAWVEVGLRRVLSKSELGVNSGIFVDASRVAARGGSQALKINPVKLTTSSESLAPSRTYSIYQSNGQLYKFGVSEANLARYSQSLSKAGPGAYGKFSSIMPKNQAHIMEKYLRSLHYNSTGVRNLPGMKIPYPRNLWNGSIIR